jgi:hypothetical protein
MLRYVIFAAVDLIHRRIASVAGDSPLWLTAAGVLVALAVLTGANGEPLSAAKATSFGLACAAVRSKSTAVGAPTPARRPSQPTGDYAAELVFGKFTPGESGANCLCIFALQELQICLAGNDPSLIRRITVILLTPRRWYTPM